jgi:hypothetical protein
MRSPGGGRSDFVSIDSEVDHVEEVKGEEESCEKEEGRSGQEEEITEVEGEENLEKEIGQESLPEAQGHGAQTRARGCSGVGTRARDIMEPLQLRFR